MWKCNQCGATSQPGGPCKCGGEFKWLSEEEGSNKKTVDEGVDLVICEACGGDGSKGECMICEGKGGKPEIAPKKNLDLQLVPSSNQQLPISTTQPQSVENKPKFVGSITSVEINDKFVQGDSSQTQKYKPIEVKNCKLDKTAQALLLDCMRQRVLCSVQVEIRYRVWASTKATKGKDPIVIMTGGRLSHIIDVLINWGNSGPKLLAWHPLNHDRYVYVFVPAELFDAAYNLIKATKLAGHFPNGLCLVGWSFAYNTTVRFGFGAMRRAVLTFFRTQQFKEIYSGFWLLDDDTMIVPRTFDEAESFTKKDGPCIIGFTQGSTKRVALTDVNSKYANHQHVLQTYKPQKSSDTLETVVLQQVVKYCGIHNDAFPSFHQGFICSGEDVSFQRFLQQLGNIPVILISGSIEKVELSNHLIIDDYRGYCTVLNQALTELYKLQNEHRKFIALSELALLNQIECTVSVGNSQSLKVSFGKLAGLIHARCLKHGNALNRTPGDILFLLVELLFCWNDNLKNLIPLPNESSSTIVPSRAELFKLTVRDILYLHPMIGRADIVELILSFL